MGAVKIEDAGECTWLRLSTGASNALTIDVVGELASAFDRAVGLGKGVVLCGGERFFCNGLDLAWALSRSPDEMRGMFLALGDLVLKMLECPVPLVGAIKGHAIGAGKTLFTACDYRYAATGRVLIGMPEILLGVPNPYFADQLVRHIAGDVVASDLIYSGRMIEAEQCVASGIVHVVFDREAVEEEGRRKALELGALPRQAFVASKAMRGARLCRRIRAGIAEHTDRLVETWYGAEAQACYRGSRRGDPARRAGRAGRRLQDRGTNPATRAHLKIGAAFHGRLYDRQVSSSPARLAFLPDFFRVYEPEIALEIGETLDPATGPFDAARIEATTRAVRPAIEIIGTHLVPWTQAGAPNLAADNAAFGHWIVGAPVSDWSRLDLLDGPVTLSVNGAVVATGKGRNVDGGAFGAAAELANALAARGRRLAAGDFITTGSVTTPVPVAAGQAVVADFGPLGQVELAL